MPREKHHIYPEDIQMIKLFQQLTLEQCIELFKKNYGNYSPYLKNKLYVIIGAKSVWGEEYKPNKFYNKDKNPE